MPQPYSTKLLRTLRREIGASIHAARLEKRMPLSKLSRLTGIPEWKLDFFELGKGEIGLEDIAKVGWVLEINLNFLQI
jgi:hypothetical protein